MTKEYLYNYKWLRDRTEALYEEHKEEQYQGNKEGRQEGYQGNREEYKKGHREGRQEGYRRVECVLEILLLVRTPKGCLVEK